MVASGPTVTGSVTIPDSERLTRRTCWAWSSMDRLRWRMPIPPWRAMAIAMSDSVTVSIAAESSGVARLILEVSLEVVSTSEGMTSVSLGSRRTSS